MIEQLSTEQLVERGREAFSRDAYPLALRYLREVVRREPEYADVHNLVGLCLSLLGEGEAALEAYDRALALNPRYVEALLNRALTLNELGRFAEAGSTFQSAAEADVEEGVGRLPAVLAGRIANKHMEVADLYVAVGALGEAVEQYRRALQLRPRFADIRSKLARTLLELGEPESAGRELQVALEVNPGFVEARINLGLAWYRRGDAAAARREWERCLEQQPGNRQVLAYLALLERQRHGTPNDH